MEVFVKQNILIITVDSFNSKVGANTFETIFKDYPDADFANICIRNELPDSKLCSRYFRISEQRVIKSVFNRKIATGKELSPSDFADMEEQKELNASIELYNKNRAKRSFIKRLGREVIWKVGKWRTKELCDFLSSFSPDIIIYEMSNYIHYNRLCRFAVRYTGAKSIGYFWDDNFTYKQNSGIKFRCMRFLQRSSLKKLAKATDSFWAITQKTKREADEEFKISSVVITKPIDIDADSCFVPYQVRRPIRMLYTGNLLIGRFESIKLISQALEAINKDDEKIILDVYTASYIPDDERAKISKYVNIHKPIPQKEVIAKQKEADILLFVEDIVGKGRKIARLSFSTKITDYLGSGKCILAIGDNDTAPMEYFRQEQIALCAGDTKELYELFERVLNNPDLINEYGERAYECAKKNHSKADVQKKVNKTIAELLEE